jgi:hypothetical protein
MIYKRFLPAAEKRIQEGFVKDITLEELRALAEKYEHPEWEKALQAAVCAECDTADEVMRFFSSAEIFGYDAAIREFINDLGLNRSGSLVHMTWNDVVIPSILDAQKG